MQSGEAFPVDDRSLKVFSLQNPLRRAAIALAVGQFTLLDLLNLLVLTGICIDIAGNFNNPHFQIFVNAFFTFDAVVKVIALGLWRPAGVAYLREGWHWVDLAATLLGWVGMSPDVVNLSFVRLVRILRLLKALSAVPSVRMLASALGSSLPLLLQCLLQIGVFFVVFGVLLEQLFSGALRFRPVDSLTGQPPPADELQLPDQLCSDAASGRPPPPGQYCEPGYPNPAYGAVASDNVALAWLLAFQCITLSGWDRIMYWNWDSQGPLAPVVFVVMVALGAFVVFNVTLTVVNDSYVAASREARRLKREALRAARAARAAAAQATSPGGSLRGARARVAVVGAARSLRRRVAALWASLRTALASWAKADAAADMQGYGRPTALARRLAWHKSYPHVESAIVAAGVVPLALYHADIAPSFALALAVLNAASVGLLACELALKLVAAGGFGAFFRVSRLHFMDLAILALGVAEVCRWDVLFWPMHAPRALRLLYLFRNSRYSGFRKLLEDATRSARLMLAFLPMLVLYILLSALCGMALFAGTFSDQAAARERYNLGGPLTASVYRATLARANFDSIWSGAVVSVFQILTADNWEFLMYSAIARTGTVASFVYFVLVYIVGQYLVLNGAMAVMLNSMFNDYKVPVRRRVSVLATSLKSAAPRPALRRRRSVVQPPEEATPEARRATGLKRWAGRARARLAERAADDAAAAALESARSARGREAGAGSDEGPRAPAGARLRQRRLSDELVHVRGAVLRGYDLHGAPPPRGPQRMRGRAQSLAMDANAELVDRIRAAPRSPPRLPRDASGPRPPTPATAAGAGLPPPALDLAAPSPPRPQPPAPAGSTPPPGALPARRAPLVIPKLVVAPSSIPDISPVAPAAPPAPRRPSVPRLVIAPSSVRSITPTAPAAATPPAASPVTLLAPPSPRTYRGQRALRQLAACAPFPEPSPRSRSPSPAPAPGGRSLSPEPAPGGRSPSPAPSHVSTARSWTTEDEDDFDAVSEAGDDAGRPSVSLDIERGPSVELGPSGGPRGRRGINRRGSIGLGAKLEDAAAARQARETLGRRRGVRSPDAAGKRRGILRATRCIVDAGFAEHGSGELAGPQLSLADIQLRVGTESSPGGKVWRSMRAAAGLARHKSVARGLNSPTAATPVSPAADPWRPKSRLLSALLRPGWSLWVFPPDLKPRRVLLGWIETEKWDRAMTLPILVSCVLLAMEGPKLPYKVAKVIHQIDYGLTAIFVGEVVAKVFAQGFLLDRRAYLHDFWNVLDLAVAIASITTVTVSQSAKRQGALLRGMHVLRALRPLELLSKSRAMQHALKSLARAIPRMARVLCLMLVVWGFYAVLGMQLFAGRIGACSDAAVARLADCAGRYLDPVTGAERDRVWLTRPQTWDNIGRALLTLYEVASLRTDWSGRMRDGIDAVGVGLSMRTDHNPAISLFFISFLVCGVFITSNWFAAVAVTSFRRVTSESRGWFKDAAAGVSVKLAPDQAQWMGALKTAVEAARPRRALVPPRDPVRRALFRLVTADHFEAAVSLLVILNVAVLCMDHYGQSGAMDDALSYVNVAFTAFFGLENLAKLLAFGWREYASDGSNIADAVIVLLCAAGAVVDTYVGGLGGQSSSAGIVRVARLLRIVRIARLFPRFRSLMTLVEALAVSVKSTAYVGLIVLVLFFVYAVTGVTVFGELPIAGPLTEDANFLNAGSALLLLCRMASGDNWSEIMWYATLARCEEKEAEGGSCGVAGAAAFFVSFMLLAHYVVVNFLAAVMLDAFADVVRRRLFVVKAADIEAFAEAWRPFDPHATGFAAVADLPALLRALGRPLGLGPTDGPREAREALLRALRIPTAADGRRVHFHVLLCGLVDRAYFARGVVPVPEVQAHYRDRYLRRPGPLLLEYTASGGFGPEHPRLTAAYAAVLLQAAWRRRQRRRGGERPVPGSMAGYRPEPHAVPGLLELAPLGPHSHRE